MLGLEDSELEGNDVYVSCGGLHEDNGRGILSCETIQ